MHLELAKAVNLPIKTPDLSQFEKTLERAENIKKSVKVLVAGKYATKESYKSLFEAIAHAGIENDVNIELSWINTKKYDAEELPSDIFQNIDAIIIPGGFGIEGAEGKIKIIQQVTLFN